MTATAEPNALLITGATVLTLDDGRTIIENGAVAIKGDRITAVGASDDLRQRFPDMEILDATGKARKLIKIPA